MLNKGGKNNDSDAWHRLKKGDIHALELVFNRYYEELYYYALKLCGKPSLAEDQIQELFLKIWKRRKNLADVSHVKAYLWTALRRSILSEMSRQRKKLYLVGNEEKLDQEFKIEFSVEELIVNKEKQNEQKNQLDQAINQLSPRHKEALILKFYSGMSYNEIEEIMSVNYQTARNYVYEALEMLRERMDQSLSPSIGRKSLIILLLFVVLPL